jgi:hypothetical protein
MPSLQQQAENFLAAVKRAFPLKIAEDIVHREAACAECVYRKGLRCTACGCILAAKQKLATEHCPIGAW